MLKYPLSTLLYIAKINIKDTIKDALRLKDNIDIRLSVTVKDKNGKIIKQHKQHSHSFLLNFLAILATLMLNPYGTFNNYYYFTDTSGAWVSLDNTNTKANVLLNMLDSANDSIYGIVVGNGTSPPTPLDSDLENQIITGTGSGDLVYGAHSIIPTPGTSEISSSQSTPQHGILPISGNTISFTVSRTFQNESGASITVSEVGIVTHSIIYNNVNNYILIIHDLLSTAITIPNGGVMAITYTISVTT